MCCQRALRLLRPSLVPDERENLPPEVLALCHQGGTVRAEVGFRGQCGRIPLEKPWSVIPGGQILPSYVGGRLVLPDCGHASLLVDALWTPTRLIPVYLD